MIRKLPIIRSQASLPDLICAFRASRDRSVGERFGSALSGFTSHENIWTINSGIAAFYIILKALARISGKDEVVLPAYTAGSLITAVRKARLKPVLCDISIDDLTTDKRLLPGALSDKTLAVVAVHMFGMAMLGIETLRSNLPKDVFLIEDCAQAMGTIVSGRRVGSFGDVSFFSFNRGKNMPICGGGAIATKDIFIAKAIEDELRGIGESSAIGEFIEPIKVLAFSLATNPYIYGVMRSALSRFKEMSPPKDFGVTKISCFQAALGLRLLKEMEGAALKRYGNGMYVINSLKDVDSVTMPDIPNEMKPAFNRLPVTFKDRDHRKAVENMMAKSGIETSRMYLRPLHHMFDLGYERSAFPNANLLAENLLTLPVHPGVRAKDLRKMVSILRSKGTD